ncbi:MAG: NAD-dependent deacylase [Bacteroidia bacterium]|nr:NAD-dependent deacylase [Bacteroidia bacterium]
MQRIVVLTGAGISAESGLKTFRGNDGLWEGHDVMSVASYEGFLSNPELVLRFYNERRKQADSALPNLGHIALVELESKYHVDIITQNVDDLHERAGSTRVLHLHGQLSKCRSVDNSSHVMPLEDDIHLGDLGPDGSQLRPHIVWFGEEVPMISKAAALFGKADKVLIVGTSLVVYPAASLIDYAPYRIPTYVVDPNRPEIYMGNHVEFWEEPATSGVPRLVQRLLDEA